jgi:hypothetical protein
MKKIIVLTVFLMLAVSYSYSQTYYYKVLAYIDKDGVKSKPSIKDKGSYITFINEKRVCYFSDENGYVSKVSKYGSEKYYFRKTQNGTHVYQTKEIVFNPFARGLRGENQEVWRDIFFYFNSDFSKMQQPPYKIAAGDADVFTIPGGEYLRTNGPEDDYDDNIPTF